MTCRYIMISIALTLAVGCGGNPATYIKTAADAIEAFTRVYSFVERHTDDAEILTEAKQALDRKDAQAMLQALTKALRTIEADPDVDVPPEIYRDMWLAVDAITVGLGAISQ